MVDVLSARFTRFAAAETMKRGVRHRPDREMQASNHEA